MEKTNSKIEYIRRSNINPMLKWVYLKNKKVNPNFNVLPPICKRIRRKSSVSHYNI